MAAQATATGFRAPCIKCGENAVMVNLDDLEHFTCRECEASFDADDVRGLMAAWGKVLGWLESGKNMAVSN